MEKNKHLSPKKKLPDGCISKKLGDINLAYRPHLKKYFYDGILLDK